MMEAIDGYNFWSISWPVLSWPFLISAIPWYCAFFASQCFLWLFHLTDLLFIGHCSIRSALSLTCSLYMHMLAISILDVLSGHGV